MKLIDVVAEDVQRVADFFTLRTLVRHVAFQMFISHVPPQSSPRSRRDLGFAQHTREKIVIPLLCMLRHKLLHLI